MKQIHPNFWLRRTLEQSFGSFPDGWAYEKNHHQTVWATYILPAALIGVNWSKAYSTCAFCTLTAAGCSLNKIPAALHPWASLSLSRDQVAHFYPWKEMQAAAMPTALSLVGKPLTVLSATHLAGLSRKPSSPAFQEPLCQPHSHHLRWHWALSQWHTPHSHSDARFPYWLNLRFPIAESQMPQSLEY